MYEEYSPDSRLKATRILLEGRVTPSEKYPDVYLVRGSQVYRVHVLTDEEPRTLTCSCPNGKALGGTPNCYHTLAVRIFTASGTEEGMLHVQEG